MLSVLVNILLFVAVIGILVFVHELGHFLAAKSVKATIHEFSLGFGPKIFSKKKKGILYSIRVIPLGGYVKVAGDGDPGKEEENEKDRKDPNSLDKKSKFAQAWVMSAGVIMNILLAIIIYYVTLGTSGWEVTLTSDLKDFDPVVGAISYEYLGDLEYSGFADESGARESGMPKEGILRSIDGYDLHYSFEIAESLSGKEGKEILVEVCVEEECNEYIVKVSKDGYLGILVSPNYYTNLSYTEDKLIAGLGHLSNIIKLSGQRISDLFTDAKATGDYSEVANTFSGPVGIYIVIDYFKQFGFISMLSLIADLSLSLALINILPLPALDGGRILILFLETILRKDLNEKVEAWIINISFGLLMLLVIGVFVKDLLTIDSLKSMFG